LGFDIVACLLELADEILIGPPKSADGLPGALGAAAHGPEGVGIARNASS